MLLCRYSYKFSRIIYVLIGAPESPLRTGWRWGWGRGGGWGWGWGCGVGGRWMGDAGDAGDAASAENCIHPAKSESCFPPPIAERQRLPNARIIASIFNDIWWWHLSIKWFSIFSRSPIAQNTTLQIARMYDAWAQLDILFGQLKRVPPMFKCVRTCCTSL